MNRPLIKICGVRDASTALEAVRAGADFIGMIARPSLLRSVSAEDAAAIVGAVRDPAVRTVAVFVDPDLGEVEAYVAKSQVDLIQLHGCETPEFCLEAERRVGRPVIKAVRIGGSFPVERFLDLPLYGLLIHPHAAFDSGDRRIFVAGGLTSENVRAAIEAARPFAVDVSSGVESGPGEKSPSMIRDFCGEVRRALN